MSAVLQFWPYLVAAGAALLALWRAYASGAKAERNANAKKELDAYEQSLKDLAAANRAGAAVRPDDGGMQSDKRNRDNARP